MPELLVHLASCPALTATLLVIGWEPVGERALGVWPEKALTIFGAGWEISDYSRAIETEEGQQSHD